MTRVRSAAALLFVTCLVVTRVEAQTPRVVTLKANDNMKYDVTAITAKPGELLKVRVVSTGTLPKIAMAHNFVLLATGTNVDKFVTAAANAMATAYIPAGMKASVLASTPQAGPGETVEVTFKAPTVPGRYRYLCTFPGHYGSGMAGWLTVR